MQDKNYDVACAKFAESQKKEPAPGTSLNLGECEERRNHLIAAATAFQIAASAYGAGEKQKYAASRAEAVDKRIPRLTIRASTPTPGLTVHVGQDAMPVDTEVKLDPGEVVVRAEAPGRKTKELRASLKEGKSLEIDIGTLDQEGNDAGAPTPPTTTITVTTPPSNKANLKTIGLVMGGVGAASLIVGGVTGVLTLGHASTVEDHCTDELACDQEGLDAAKSGDTLATISTITFIAGGAALVGGAVLFYLGSKKPSSSAPAVQVLPTAGGMMMLGRF